MTTASSIAKVSVGKSGCGAAHASYITRMSALDPEGRERARSNAEERFEQLSLLTHDQTEKTEPSVTETLKDSGSISGHSRTTKEGKEDEPITA